MPDRPSAIPRLRPARRRCAPRRFESRAQTRVIVMPKVSAGQSQRARGRRTSAWTLYSRWQWFLATTRAERARRRFRPPWR